MMRLDIAPHLSRRMPRPLSPLPPLSCTPTPVYADATRLLSTTWIPFDDLICSVEWRCARRTPRVRHAADTSVSAVTVDAPSIFCLPAGHAQRGLAHSMCVAAAALSVTIWRSPLHRLVRQHGMLLPVAQRSALMPHCPHQRARHRLICPNHSCAGIAREWWATVAICPIAWPPSAVNTAATTPSISDGPGRVYACPRHRCRIRLAAIAMQDQKQF
jgi:hypothetical protein